MPMTPLPAFSGLFSAGTLPGIAVKKGKVRYPRGRLHSDSNSQFQKNGSSATKTRQIILNMPGFFFFSLDEPVILSATDQRRDTEKGSGGVRGEKRPPSGGPFTPDRTPEKFLWCPGYRRYPFAFLPGKLRIAGVAIAQGGVIFYY
jgi:hypothetical protein